MNTPQSISPRRSLRALCALGLSLVSLAVWASSANAYLSPAQAKHAAERGANWFEANQEESGNLSTDWGMTALAAAGVNAADVSTSLAEPSAQDFYLDEWQTAGPGGAGTDAERGILSGVAGGIQPSRLSTSSDATQEQPGRPHRRTVRRHPDRRTGTAQRRHLRCAGAAPSRSAAADPAQDRRLPAHQAACLTEAGPGMRRRVLRRTPT